MNLPLLNETLKSQKKSYEQKIEEKNFEVAEQEHSAWYVERIKKTCHLFQTSVSLKGQKIADLGCGLGKIASYLAQEGNTVVAVDACEKTLQSNDPRITYKKACIPYLPFGDDLFDGIVFTDVIAEIETHLHRLTLSELARLLKPNGWMICSTELDLHTYGAYEQFIQLLKTEFEILQTIKSYHRLLSWFPLQLFQHNRRIRTLFERISKFLWGQMAMTHVIVLARKKKILYNL